MATIAQALERGLLHEFRMPDHDGRAPVRPLYIADCFYDWADHADELHERNWHRHHGSRTRFEHMVQAFADFRCDPRPLVGELNRICPTSKGVWKIQPPGTRIFGWVPRPHAFVVVHGALDTETHGRGNVIRQRVADVIKFAKDNRLERTILRGDRIALFSTQA